MKPITNKIPNLYQNVFYALLAICWLTGVGFYILDIWFMVESEFGSEKHFLQLPSLQIHAATAFFIMVFFGAFFFGHMSRVKKMAHSQKSGWTLISALAYLIFSAYLLYYIGNESMRIFVMYSHLIIGFLLPVMLICHLISHKRNKQKLKK